MVLNFSLHQNHWKLVKCRLLGPRTKVLDSAKYGAGTENLCFKKFQSYADATPERSVFSEPVCCAIVVFNLLRIIISLTGPDRCLLESKRIHVLYSFFSFPQLVFASSK